MDQSPFRHIMRRRIRSFELDKVHSHLLDHAILLVKRLIVNLIYAGRELQRSQTILVGRKDA